MLSSVAFSASNAGITYNGRLMGPDGLPVEGLVQFRIQVRTPNSSDCLLYQETKNLNLTGKNGYFTLTLNDGTGTRLTGSYALERVFANQGSFNVTDPNLDCGGSTTYNPSPVDGRKMKVYFRESSFAPNDWEELPTMDINFVPTSIESVQVGGFKADHLLRVQDASGVPQVVAALSPANFTELLALVNGSSTRYLQSSTSVGTSVPVVPGSPVTPSAGSLWFDSSDQKMKYYDGTSTQVVSGGGGGGSGSVTSVAADGGLQTDVAAGAAITGTGTISIADSGVSTAKIADGAVTSAKLEDSGVTAGTYGSSSLIPKIVVDAKGRITSVTEETVSTLPSGTNGHFLKSSGGSTWVSSAIHVDDIKNAAASPYFNFSSACTLEKTLIYDSVNDRMTCSAIGVNANQVTAGTFDKARLPAEAIVDGGNSPAATMIVGAKTGQDLELRTSDVARLMITSSGNVGVGTVAAPTSKFVVEGGDAKINGLTVGLGGGAVTSNLAVGLDALKVNTSGTNNTAVGKGALSANVAGGSNTAIGVDAMKINTGGAANVAVGMNSLTTNSLGTSNVGVGMNSLRFNDEGSYNTAVGQNSQQWASQGQHNTSIGYQSLVNNNNGSYNTAVGSNALQVVKGSNNVGVGQLAGGAITTGANNTIVGTMSSTFLTTGNNNTIVGYLSGGSITTQSNVVILGSFTGAGMTDGEVSVGSTVATSIRIDPTGKVGIGMAAPTEKLEVNGKIKSTNTRSIASATNEITTTSTTFVDVPDMYVPVNSGNLPMMIFVNMGSCWSNTTNAVGYFQLLQDGVVVASSVAKYTTSDLGQPMSFNWMSSMTAGTHSFKVQWRTSAGTLTCSWGSSTRSLIVWE